MRSSSKIPEAESKLTLVAARPFFRVIDFLTGDDREDMMLGATEDIVRSNEPPT